MNELVKAFEEGKAELDWFYGNLPRFKEKYTDQFIAYKHKKFLGADKDYFKLMAKVKKKGIDFRKVSTEFITKDEIVWTPF